MIARKQGFYTFARCFFLFSIIPAVLITLLIWMIAIPILKLLGFESIGWISAAAGFGIVGIVFAMSYIYYKLIHSDSYRKLREDRPFAVTWELVSVCILLIVGTILRWLVIALLPVEPSSDYATYYGLADVLNRNALSEEGAWYCKYVSLFPHVLGYPAVLSLIFRIFGTSIRTAQIFNLCLQVLSCGLIWHIARSLGGRISGLIALALASFMPSVVLYSNIVGSEALFSCLLLTATDLFVQSVQQVKEQDTHPWLCFLRLVLLALVLSFASFIRPMGIIFLIAAVICILTIKTEKMEGSARPKSIGTQIINRRWKKVLILLIIYFAGSSVASSWTARTIGREPAGATSSFGFNLLVGLNQESYGFWNSKDAAFLDLSLTTSGSADDAQRACRDLAFERVKSNPNGLPLLFVIKYIVLLGTDDYGAYWNSTFLNQQGELNPSRNIFLKVMLAVSHVFYLFMLLGVVYYSWTLFRKKPGADYAILLYLCGTIVLHILVEVQNRYHYPMLLEMAILSSLGFHTLNCDIATSIIKRKRKKHPDNQSQ